jgi:hypothetical protein
MHFILDFGTVGDGKADSTEASNDVLRRSAERVQSAEGAPSPWGREIRGFLGQSGLESQGGSALSEQVFEFGLDGVDGFAGGGAFLLGEGSQLLHQSRETAVGSDPGGFGLLQSRWVSRLLQVLQRGLLQRIQVREQ